MCVCVGAEVHGVHVVSGVHGVDGTHGIYRACIGCLACLLHEVMMGCMALCSVVGLFFYVGSTLNLSHGYYEDTRANPEVELLLPTGERQQVLSSVCLLSTSVLSVVANNIESPYSTSGSTWYIYDRAVPV